VKQPTTLSDDDAVATARTFIQQHWGEIADDLVEPRLSRRRVVDLHDDGTSSEWAAGYRVYFSIGIEGIVVDGGFVAVSIAGDQVIECRLRLVEPVISGDSIRIRARASKDLWHDSLPEIRKSVGLSEQYAIAHAELRYTTTSKLSDNTKDDEDECVPAWRFNVYRDFNNGSPTESAIDIWVDAVTGELLHTSGKAAP
jgi:hypothetical protein